MKKKNNNTLARALLIVVSSCVFAGSHAQIVDTYNFKMRLDVPRIYDNMQSMGYRKYQPQILKGELQFVYRDSSDVQDVRVRVLNLYNKTHRINGRSVTYICSDSPSDETALVVGVGSNKTGQFKVGSAMFSFVADPSYNIGSITEDNVLQLKLSGHGRMSKGCLKTIKGQVVGRIGCGCMAYGHVSPTRLYLGWITSVVVDIAAVHGRFRATFKSRRYEPDDPIDDEEYEQAVDDNDSSGS